MEKVREFGLRDFRFDILKIGKRHYGHKMDVERVGEAKATLENSVEAVTDYIKNNIENYKEYEVVVYCTKILQNLPTYKLDEGVPSKHQFIYSNPNYKQTQNKEKGK